MSFKQFFIYIGLFLLLTIIAFFIFSKVILLASPLDTWVVGIVTSLITIACCRRLGDISYLEAVMVALVWLFSRMFLDLLITAQALGGQIYKTPLLWISYFAIFASIFFFHKKRHVGIRKVLKASGHGGHH